MSESILSGIKTFLEACPIFDGNSLRVNFLPGEPLEFTVEDVPSSTIVKRYIGGQTVRQALFLVASREVYSQDAIENLRASGVYDQLADWMEQQTNNGNLPKLPPGMTARKIEATTNGYCMEADILQNVQRYQIQCRMTYDKEAI